MVTQHKNFTMMRGDTYQFSVKFNGFNEDRSVESMFFTVSSNLVSDSLEFWLSLENGITRSEDPNEYIYFIKIAPSDTKKMLPGVYFYDLQVQIDEDVFTLLSGDLIIKADVTPNDADDFFKVSEADGVDPNEYFAALEVTDAESFFYIESDEYYNLAYDMAKVYAKNTHYFKNQFVIYQGNLYSAVREIESSPEEFNINDWNSMSNLTTNQEASNDG